MNAKIKEEQTKISIGGEEYPLVFSMAATKKILERFKSFEGMTEKVQYKKDEPDDGSSSNQKYLPEEALDAVIFMLTVLINEGVKREKIINKESALREFSEDEIALLIELDDLSEYLQAVFATINKVGNIKADETALKKT